MLRCFRSPVCFCRVLAVLLVSGQDINLVSGSKKWPSWFLAVMLYLSQNMTKRAFTIIVLLLGGFFVSGGTVKAEEVRPMLFPVIGKTNFTDEFGAPRVGHTHQGNDVFAAKHSPLVAAVSGTISFVTWPQATYGYFVSIRGDDGSSYWYVIRRF